MKPSGYGHESKEAHIRETIVEFEILNPKHETKSKCKFPNFQNRLDFIIFQFRSFGF